MWTNNNFDGYLIVFVIFHFMQNLFHVQLNLKHRQGSYFMLTGTCGVSNAGQGTHIPYYRPPVNPHIAELGNYQVDKLD